MGRMWLLPLLLGFLVVRGTVAEACSCAPRSATCGPPEDFWRVSAVFSGRVTAIDRAADRGSSAKRRIRLQVVEKFRGDVAGTGGDVSVYTDAAALCGFPFRVGKEYFVYARQDQGRLVTSACSRTALLERAERDLAYARLATTGGAPPGRIVGEVRLAGEVRTRSRLLPGVQIVLASQGPSATAMTDSWGQYAIEPPGKGTYVLDVQLPETQYTPGAAQLVQFSNPHSCSEVNIDVFYNGRVNGRVTDVTGRGIAGLTVSYERSTRDNERLDRRRVLTRDDGTYSLERLTPGAFVIRAELPADERDRDGDVDRAPLISATLGPGERRSLPSLVVLPSFRLARLEGTVHDLTGLPATNARVFLKGGEGSAPILGEPAVTDTLGRFVMTVVEGTHYDVFAERQLSDRRGTEFSDPVTFTALSTMSPVRLTLRRRF